MKRLLLIVFFSLLVFPIYTNAETTGIGSYDGNDWTQWESYKKVIFVSGFLAGSGLVIEENLKPYVDDKCDHTKAEKMWGEYIFPKEINPKRKNIFSRNEIDLILCHQDDDLKRYGLYEITVGQLVDGFDLLYSDFKNKQIVMRDAIYVVKKQIKGASPEEIEALLQYLRSDNDPHKLVYTDKNGKIKCTALHSDDRYCR